jgi:CRISPR type IV-associated protein Csf2
METKKYIIHAFLTTVTPLHIASPEKARVDTDTMEVIYTSKGAPMTPIQKLAVYGPDNKMHEVPVIAANNIMGHLRDHISSKVIDVLIAKGQKVAMATYSAMTCGAATGKPDGDDVTFDEYRAARRHPFVGLLGGGPRMMRRYVWAHNAVPFMDATRIMFERMRHPNLDEDAHCIKAIDRRKLVYRWLNNRNDDVQELKSLSQMQEGIESFEEKIIARQALILKDKKDKDKERSGDSDGETKPNDRNTTRSFSVFEFVIPGVVFPIVFELDVTKAQLGLFLVGLDSFTKSDRLGGHVRNGLGQFSFSDVVIQNDDGDVVAQNVFHQSRLQQDHEFVAEHLLAWSQAAAEITGAELDLLYAPKPEKAEKPAKEKKKPAAAENEA